MNYEHSMLKKVRFFLQLGVIYGLSTVFVWYVIHPLSSYTLASATNTSKHSALLGIPLDVVSGIPDRIVIPDSSYDGTVVDLPIDPGYYNASTATWTLSGYRAQFAMTSSLANNFGGETYIYGHNNDYVFGALRHVTPVVGSTALLYTTNGHIFSYTFVEASSIAPDMTSVLEYNGPPIMVIQTCTGSFNEVRTLYYYNFQSLIK